MFSYKKHGKYPIANDGEKKVYLNEDEIQKDSKLKTEGKFEMYPRDDGERTCGYITGSSGAGKTTWIKNYCEKYHKIYKKAPIYMISEKTEDPSIDKLKYVKRVIVDDDIQDISEIPLDNYLPNTLLIFDDYIDLPKKYLMPIMALIRRVLKLGRQYKISCLVVSHIINPTTNREFTREILLESHFICWFNQDNVRGTNYYLKTYAGLDNKTIQDLQCKKGRIVIHSNRFPQYIITEKEILKI